MDFYSIGSLTVAKKEANIINMKSNTIIIIVMAILFISKHNTMI